MPRRDPTAPGGAHGKVRALWPTTPRVTESQLIALAGALAALIRALAALARALRSPASLPGDPRPGADAAPDDGLSAVRRVTWLHGARRRDER